MGWFDDVSGWFDTNSSWLEPVAKVGSKVYDYWNKSSSSDDIMGWMRDQEQRNYDQSLANHTAYNDWYNSQYLPAAQANAAASARNAQAQAAAANRTEQARQQAQRKAFGIQKNFYKKQKGLLDPYVQTGQRLLPQMEKLYSGGMDMAGMLQAYMAQPQQMAKLNQSVPSYQVDVPLPKYMMGRKA